VSAELGSAVKPLQGVWIFAGVGYKSSLLVLDETIRMRGVDERTGVVDWVQRSRSTGLHVISGDVAPARHLNLCRDLARLHSCFG
jgi:hypothetical protein